MRGKGHRTVAVTRRCMAPMTECRKISGSGHRPPGCHVATLPPHSYLYLYMGMCSGNANNKARVARVATCHVARSAPVAARVSRQAGKPERQWQRGKCPPLQVEYVTIRRVQGCS